jgi:lysophospholipase L1-like esterase
MSREQNVKTIVCFGDSNTWGADPIGGGRFDINTRWTGVLANALGPDYRVIEEGLNGRTTVVDDILSPNRNGLEYLKPCIDSHHPFDLITIMLGTNDLKARLNRSATDIAESASLLAETVKATSWGPNGARPEVLIICPPKVEGLTGLADMFVGAEEKSAKMPALYEYFSHWSNSAFLDAGQYIKTSPADGIHFEAAEHAKLGKAVAEKIRSILEG